MTISNFLGLLSGVTALLAYAFYLKQAIKGQSTPNPSSWAIWFLAGIINTFTYFSVVNGNIWQSLFVVAITFSILIVLVYSLFKGKFTKITNLEVVIFLMAIAIGIFWQITSNDRISNLLLQSIYVISYIPTIIGITSGRAKENYNSWLIAVIAYFFTTLSLITNYPGDWISFISPILNGMLGNGLIVYLILRRRFR